MTDKPKDDPIPAVLSEVIENLEEIGKGNNVLLPCFHSGVSVQSSVKKVQQSSSVDNLQTETSTAAQANESSESIIPSHMVMHKGAFIDIEKLLQQLNRSERAREETELRLTELNKMNSELQSGNSKAKDKIKDLQSELKSCNRKISDAESTLTSVNVSYIFF